ncbi:hypothetical protein GCM10020295_11860 [Streptomyces cinereospinus]
MTRQALITGIGGKQPRVGPGAFVAPTAAVIGDVTLGGRSECLVRGRAARGRRADLRGGEQ